MTNKFVAVEGCTLILSSGTALSVQITTSASSKHKVDGKGIYFGTLTIKIDGFTSEKIDAGGMGVGTLNPTASLVSSNKQGIKQKVVRVDDVSEQIFVSGTKSGNPATDIVTVKISNAGQKKVKAA